MNPDIKFEKLWEEVIKICKNEYDIICQNNAKFVGQTIFSNFVKIDQE